MRRRAAASLALLVAACAALAESQVEYAIRALRQDSSMKVRAQAAIVLGQRGAAAAVPALVEALQEDGAPAVRIAAASALGRVGDASARPALELAMRADRDEKVREAAWRALDEWTGAADGVLAFVVEETSGSAGSPRARQALHDSIARHLKGRGYAVVETGGGYRIKPSVLRLDVDTAGGRTTIAVRASLVAVDGKGRMAAILEGGARLRASGAIADAALDRYSVQALDAAARTLCDDLARRLGER
jgi:hypothetical protein